MTRSEQPSSLEQSTSGETCVNAVWQLLRPLGLCHELLTPHTVTVYLLPVLVSVISYLILRSYTNETMYLEMLIKLQECIPTLLESLTDEELKREARGSENKTDTVSCLIRACKCVSLKTPQHHSLLKCKYAFIHITFFSFYTNLVDVCF